MRKVTEMPRTVGRPEKYPYKEWFNGEMNELTKGEDFDTSIESLRGALAQAKDRYKVTLKTAKSKDGKTLTLQATPIKPVAKKAPAKKKPAAKKAAAPAKPKETVNA